MRIVAAMLLVALLMPAGAFAALPDDAGMPAFHDVVYAEFQPGVSAAKVVLDSGYAGELTMLYAPEIKEGRMHVSLNAICEVLDCPIDFNKVRCELVISAIPKIRVPVSVNTMEKIACGENICIMLPLRKTFEGQGWRVDWHDGKVVTYRYR